MIILKRLLSEIKPFWKLFSLGMLLMALSSFLAQVAPLYVQKAIDLVLTPISHGQPIQLGLLWQWLGAFLGLTALGSIMGYLSTRLLMHVANRVGELLRNRAYDTMQGLPIAYFDDKPAGKISARIVNDTETLRAQFYGTMLSQALINLLWVITIYGILIYLNLWLGLTLLVLIPIFIVWHHYYAKETEQAMTDFYEAQSELNSQVNEAMNGASIIQLFGQEKTMARQFEGTAAKMLRSDLQITHVEATMSWSLVELLKRLVLALILSVIGQAFLGNHLGISVGLIFSYVNYTERLFNALGSLVRMLPNMQRSLTTGRRVYELLDQPLEVDTAKKLTVSRGDVRFEHVSFAYEDKEWVLKDISLHARPGETIALVGHTGSGKSSIMNLLFRFYDPQQGQILIDDQVIQDYQRESVRSQMGIVLQDPYLFTGTIASNVTMDNEQISPYQVLEALKKVGAGPMIERLTNGIDEPVVEKGNAFSSGERQLIAFARTLACDPKILILDEATSHIDTETEEIIQKAMDVLKEGRTTFIIAHRLSTIQNADQILVLHEGQIVERGNHQELLAQNGRYAAMYRIQQVV
ncbi:ABC transporter ATP-binding protein [Streptococcus ovuberis]|uniref:ABC transporter ATP-binding protein n=1 Tax=Streptococcus ovuberis TaxID=1936207 RepID=A0A7X6S0W2_9STRE|nr:ABC transporter ATP-binding protein [Streptococcus ovuberis]NKZ20539.1 ABC transporter ATP-binding protein [Streptococcus ovuberis]